MTTQFDQIIQANYTPREIHNMANDDKMPAVTPGEGGVFGLATVLIGAGLTANFTEHVQLACIGGGVLLGFIGAITHGTIRVARNNALAVKEMAKAEIHSALAYANEDHDED